MAVNDKTQKTLNMQINLKKLRELAGLSAQSLADEINVTKQTIHRFELEEKPTKMTYCQYRTIRFVFEEISQKRLESDPNNTDLQDAITLLIDRAEELSEEEYAKTQNAVKVVSASKSAGVVDVLLRSTIRIVAGVSAAVIIGLLNEKD